jgi:hypothetical protein
MFIVTWLFDKLGYMPKISIDTNWKFPVTQQDYVAPEFEKPVVKKTTKVAKKPITKKPTQRKAK